MDKWNSQNEDARKFLHDNLKNSQSLLTNFYDIDIIYPKYHTLPALTSIYEYLVTGRCDELTGPHGAYNLYEDEVRKDTVISQLNLVIDNLESIKQNQYMLYQQVTAIQQNLSVMSREIQSISANTRVITELTAINTYYTALNARCNEISAAYHLLS